MRVALISIGHCPSLATRNLRRYCQSHEELRDVEFLVVDEDIRDFTNARTKSTQRWSFATARDALLERMQGFAPDIVGFSCYLWSTELSVEMAAAIKRLLPTTQIVLGGPDVGPRAQDLLRRHLELDAIVEGDGELPFLAIVRRRLEDRRDVSGIAGVVHRSAAGLRAEPPSGLADLSLLRDVWTDVPNPQDLARWSWSHVLYETMRGCPYACSYCMYGKVPANRKEVGVVVDELHALLAKGVAVEIIDPTFTTYAKRAREILRGLSERTYTGTLYFEAYPDSIDDEMIDLVRRTNVARIGIGFQTVSSAGLDAVSRPKNLEKFERAIRLLRAADVRFYVDVIYGLPGTTAADFVDTMDYLFERGISEVVVYRLLGLPGSPMMNDIATYGLVFNPSPPYELLKSTTFELEDVLFCERFRETWQRLRALGDELVHRFAKASGGKLSAFVRRVMDSGALDRDDPNELKRVLAGIMLGDPTLVDSKAS